MEHQKLKAGWRLLWHGKELETEVPCSLYTDLYRHGEIPDPYFRDNAAGAEELSREDCTYALTFDAAPEVFACPRAVLRFDGVDTLAEIVLNGTVIGKTYNMHRVWEFEVRGLLRETENVLEVRLSSPLRYLAEQVEKNGSIPCNTDTTDGFPYLRKSSCMFGWDWGPRLPDMGIFRDVTLLGIHSARLTDVLVRQHHEEGSVRLSFSVRREGEADGTRITVFAPDGSVAAQGDSPDALEIKNPQLWWPRGYGEQPLYTVRVELLSGGAVEDVWERRIGLRTMTVHREKDEWGESFAHEVNGVRVFAMGADYIPEDCLLPQITPETTRRLLEQCVEANYNAVRVWGGGFYPHDWFFDLCDEFGLLVWQDLMFACATYRLTEEFEENISREIEDNVRRIRHHASLGLWCGNNEMESFLYEGYGETPLLKGDYTRMYSYVIPKIIRREDPDAFYWPSSPSSGGDFDDPQDETRGDAHYWAVWHGYRPFPDYRLHTFRYASEFGFESMPSMKQIEAFTEPEDRNPFSFVMQRHQKCFGGFSKMMVYMTQYLRYPTSLEEFVYASQLLQAQAMRYAVEHWRRHRGQCMGTIVWQLNDCWPVASWSSIDYSGRWKALHYFEKRFFAPVLLSCCEEGMLSQDMNLNTRNPPFEKSIRLNVVNETRQDRVLTVRWSLRDSRSKVIGGEHEQEIAVPALSTVWLDKVELPQARVRQDHVVYTLLENGETVSEGSVLFGVPQIYEYADPKLTARVEGDEIVVSAEAYAGSVAIRNENDDLLLSDNYFDMEAGEKRVKILSGSPECLQLFSLNACGR